MTPQGGVVCLPLETRELQLHTQTVAAYQGYTEVTLCSNRFMLMCDVIAVVIRLVALTFKTIGSVGPLVIVGNPLFRKFN